MWIWANLEERIYRNVYMYTIIKGLLGRWTRHWGHRRRRFFLSFLFTRCIIDKAWSEFTGLSPLRRLTFLTAESHTGNALISGSSMEGNFMLPAFWTTAQSQSTASVLASVMLYCLIFIWFDSSRPPQYICTICNDSFTSRQIYSLFMWRRDGYKGCNAHYL